MFDTIINAIDVDVAFVLSLLLFSAVVFISGIAGYKRQNDPRTVLTSHGDRPLSARRTHPEVDSWLRLGDALTFVATIPATVYIVTRAFPGFYQQLIVGFVVLALFAGIKQIRTVVQIGLSVVILLAIGLVTLPFRIAVSILLYAYRRLRSDSNVDDATDDTSTTG